jgi:amidase
MSPKILPVIQTVPIPSGSTEHEAARQSVLESLASSVPDDLVLPSSIIDNPPKNVIDIPKTCGLLTQEELEITSNYDAVALAEAIASQKLTAVAVATAFAKRAIIAHQLTSCLTEWFMDEAVKRAEELDEHLRTTGKTVGALHGVPISVKAHIPLAGHWSNVGYFCTHKLDETDSQMMRILRESGAVFYCKTNQPQAIMHLESTSPWGRVLNPYNINLSAGGSSGGESALVALRGSVLGVGTDIGGSIRGPSAFCGIYGFKPTSYTLPMKDFIDGGPAAELNILCSTGPMCTSVRDMDLFMSVNAAARPYLEDPRVLPIPWTGLSTSRDSSSRPIKIGIMSHDGVIVPQPPVIKALEWARLRLRHTSQVQVKNFEPYGVRKAMTNIRLAYWPDGGELSRKLLYQGGEPTYPLTEWILKDATEGGPLTAMGVYQQRRDRDDFRCDFAKHWASQDVDFVLCPAFVGPACMHDTAWYWNYTALWNYLDCPGVVFPTPVKAGSKGTEDYANSDALSDECTKVRQLWAEGDFEGAPVNLQIVGRRHHDNELFGALAALKDVLQLY